MLVIGRKKSQGLWIGTAHVIVVAIERGKVRLAIDAPPDIAIKRDELIGEPVSIPMTADGRQIVPGMTVFHGGESYTVKAIRQDHCDCTNTSGQNFKLGFASITGRNSVPPA